MSVFPSLIIKKMLLRKTQDLANLPPVESVGHDPPLWRLRTCDQLYQLRRAGTLVELEPKVFDLLVCLVEHRERVVSKSDNTDITSLCCIRTTIVIKGSNTWEQKFQSTTSDSQHFVSDITFVSSRFSARAQRRLSP